MSEIFGFDAFSPKEIVERVQFVGVTKARLPLLSQMTLGILAGGFIGLGALYYTVVASDGSWALPRAGCLADSHFRLDSSFGLILVVVAGAELFTGNNLLVMA